ncbi:MAG: hypothetical protein QXG44_06175 [Candidatus Jordarchaeaceae archaeon]
MFSPCLGDLSGPNFMHDGVKKRGLSLLPKDRYKTHPMRGSAP